MLDTKQKKGPCTCPECEFQPFTRNHYFTGKLLVERDFCQEQDYYRNKLRLHEHRLHGSGVVCGLLVKQHPNPACRSRFVCIEPGLAIDCCGHEILVAEEDCTVDLTQLESMKPLFAKPDDPTQYTLQICIRYKECPTEQIPVLYDDCGCDDTRCAPNRILESYEIGVIVNPDLSQASPLTPSLSRKHTVNVAHAAFAAVDTAQHRLYVLDATPTATLSQFSTDNQAFLAGRTIGGQAVALAVSSDGNRVYVVVAPAPGGSDYQLLVVDASKPGLLPGVQNNPIAIPGSANRTFSIAMGPDGHLYGLNSSSGDLIRWGTDIDSAQNAATPAALITIAPAPSAFALSGNGKQLYAVGGNEKIQVVDLSAATQSSLAALPAQSAPSAIAVVNTASGELLAVADRTNKKLYLVDPSAPAQTKGPVQLNRPPIRMLVAPDGRWGYLVESDQQQGYVTTVDLAGMLQGVAVAPGPELPLGLGAENPVLDPTGQTLYVPYTGSANVADDGGVAIVDISETDCCGLFWKAAETCDDCPKPNCIVLATIFHYAAGYAFTDQPDPPSDPQADANNKIARIDNHAGRHLLPSTSTLYEAIECLCESGVGGKGSKGDPGQDGQQGPKGVDGKDGQGLEQNLTGIKALSWQHAGPLEMATIKRLSPGAASATKGVVIQFTGRVRVPGPGKPGDIDADHVFQILVRSDPAASQELGLLCRCPVVGTVVPVQVTGFNGKVITGAKQLPFGSADAVAFLIENKRILVEIESGPSDVFVVLRGDFILDMNGKAVDAEFVRAQLPTGDRLGPSAVNPLGLQGGTFESWFGLKRSG